MKYGTPLNTTESKTGTPTKSKLGLDRKTWTFRFVSEGKTYTLYKRKMEQDAPWSIKTIIDGINIRRALDTNVAEVAVKRAVAEFIKPAKAGRWAEVVPDKPDAPAPVPTVGEMLATYQEFAAGDVSPFTVRNNLSAFRLVVRRGLGREPMLDAEVDALPATVLTGRLVSEFEEWMKREALVKGRDLESNKRSVASNLRQARSVFKELFVPKYAERGLALPALAEFMGRATARPARLVPYQASDELMEKTQAASLRLRESDRPAYIAWLLGLATLRRGEVAQARWDYLLTIKGEPVLVLPAEKTKSGVTRAIPLDEWIVAELADWRTTLPPDEEFILPSPRASRGGRLRMDSLFKRVNVWMRALGWTTNHTLHSMRAHGLQQVEDEFGLTKASGLAGHQDERTTKRHYTGTIKLTGVKVRVPAMMKVVMPAELTGAVA